MCLAVEDKDGKRVHVGNWYLYCVGIKKDHSACTHYEYGPFLTKRDAKDFSQLWTNKWHGVARPYKDTKRGRRKLRLLRKDS